MRNFFITVILCIVLLFNVQVTFGDTQRPKYNLGIIITHMAVSPTAILEACRPFAKYISNRLNVDFEVEIIPDINQMLKRLNEGTLSFGYVSNLDYVKLKKQKNITPFTKVVKGGTSMYHAVLLVRSDSGINSLKDLKGKRFVYSSENSSHGYLYPKLLIKNNFNQSLENFFGKMIITKKDPDGILAVLYKRADAVSASSQTLAILTELMPRLKRELKVISKSQPLVHGPMFYYSDNIKDKTIISRVEKEMLNMENVTEGKQVLLLFKIGGWTKASDSNYNPLRTMLGK